MFKSCEDYPDSGLRKRCDSHLDTVEGKTPDRNGGSLPPSQCSVCILINQEAENS